MERNADEIYKKLKCLEYDFKNKAHKTLNISYYEFTVAKYALSDCIESLKK